VVAEAEPQQAKALLRLLIAELKVNGRADIRPTYRVVTPTGLRNVRKSGRNLSVRKPGRRCRSRSAV